MYVPESSHSSLPKTGDNLHCHSNSCCHSLGIAAYLIGNKIASEVSIQGALNGKLYAIGGQFRLKIPEQNITILPSLQTGPSAVTCMYCKQLRLPKLETIISSAVTCTVSSCSTHAFTVKAAAGSKTIDSVVTCKYL